MKKLFLFLLLIPLLVKSQSTTHNYSIDSLRYYQTKINKLWRSNYDSLIKSAPYIAIRDSAINYITRRNNFTAFVLYNDLAHSNYAGFDKLIAQDGFSPLSTLSYRIGLGISFKTSHAMIDFYFATLGFGNHSDYNNQTIKSSLSNVLQLDIGHDLLNKERVSLYPFVGLSLRSSDISYSRNSQSNPNYTDITNMRTDENNVSLESFGLGYQYGIGFDYAFAYNKQKTYKSILFTKIGVNRPFGDDIYKDDNNGISGYKPGIKQGDWIITIGVKFATKR